MVEQQKKKKKKKKNIECLKQEKKLLAINGQFSSEKQGPVN